MDNNERTYLMWKTYEAAESDEIKAEILAQFEEEISGLTPKEYVKSFKDAPDDVILAYLPDMDADLQVMTWKTALPVASRAAARKLLKREAMEKLGLVPKLRSKWLKAMCLDR